MIIESLKTVHAVKLWTGLIVDLNDISGFTSPYISRPPDNYAPFDASNMEFIIHTHSNTITVNENLPDTSLIIRHISDESWKCFVRYNNTHLTKNKFRSDGTIISNGWLQIDRHYTPIANTSMVCFHEFITKFNELVYVWNAHKDIQYIPSNTSDM